MKEEHTVQHPNTLLTTLSKRMLRKTRRAGYLERGKSGSEGVSVKPDVAIC